jgi:DNA modification methylase
LIIQDIKVSELKHYKNNPRKNDQAVEIVAKSIKEFGFKVPVVIDTNNEIVCGHTRVKAAAKLGMDSVPCIVADDLTNQQIKAFRLVDNKTSEYAEWDLEKLDVELSDLVNMSFDMQPFDFAIVRKNEVTEDDFDVEAAIPEIATTKRGDIWQLGRHRLMCGDSTVQSDAKKLMSGKLGDMVFTDPPYNIDYEGATKDKLKILNDSMPDLEFYKFLYNAYVCMINNVTPGSAIYVCHSDNEGVNFRKAMRDAGWEQKQCIIWIKNAFILGRQDHQWQHEPILYGWKLGAGHRWFGNRKQSTVIKPEDGVFVEKTGKGFQLTFNSGIKKVVINVPEYDVVQLVGDEITTTWYIDKPVRNAEHPTMKPIKLCARAIKNSSREEDVVIDFFGGAGSTLMACEQMNRICYTMELDEKYCDVIIKRWEVFTEQKAVLI